jgi:hypothetical protein
MGAVYLAEDATTGRQVAGGRRRQEPVSSTYARVRDRVWELGFGRDVEGSVARWREVAFHHGFRAFAGMVTTAPLEGFGHALGHTVGV